MKTIANFAAAIWPAIWKDESGITSVEYAVLFALAMGGVIIGVEILDGSAQSGSGWASVR